MKRDAILINLQDYHLDLVDKVVRLIVSTTREYSDEDEFETLIEGVLAGDLDAFFSEATSMLFCDGGCEIESYAGWFRMNKRKVAAHFDTFPQVVKHQLETHNDYEASLQPGRQGKHQSEAGFRFTLPLEVASVMTDLVDIVRSRPKTEEDGDEGEEGGTKGDLVITKDHLNDLDDGNFGWTNASDKEGYVRSWMNLVSLFSLLLLPWRADILFALLGRTSLRCCSQSRKVSPSPRPRSSRHPLVSSRPRSIIHPRLG